MQINPLPKCAARGPIAPLQVLFIKFLDMPTDFVKNGLAPG
jgi:hypothetical protein